MFAEILAITILNSDGSVQYQSPQPPREFHHYYESSRNSFDFQDQLNQMVENTQRETERQAALKYYNQNQRFEEDLLRYLHQ